MDWAKDLHMELADAQALLLSIQNALVESDGELTGEIAAFTDKLAYRASVITGHVTRWALWKQLQKPIPPNGPASRSDVAIYCLLHADAIYISVIEDGKRRNKALTEFTDAEIAQWVDRWWGQKQYPGRIVEPEADPKAPASP